MYKIGEFAKLTNTSIRTLRFYDQEDLFKPDDIDLFTGYRYYSEAKIEEFNLIKKLQSLGFSLEEIKSVKDNITEDVLLKKKNELITLKDDIDDQIKQLDIMRSELKQNIPTLKVKKKERYNNE